MKAKVFVSYKHGDNESERLLSLLGKKLFATIYSDRGLSFGEFRPNLLRWIDFCDFFVVLISEKGVKSDEVRGEVRHVRDRWLAADRRKPIIIPVRVNYSEPVKEFLGDLHENQILSWTGEDDNKEDKETLRKIRWAVAKAMIPWLSKAIAAMLALSLLVYIFLFAPFGNIQKLRSASPATESAAGNVISLTQAKIYRDHGRRPGWSSRAEDAYAQYLARWSEWHLKNARKSIDLGKVPEGLVLAALVAQENGGHLDPSFLKDYEEGNYASLKKTLRTGFPLSAGLAVSSDGTQIAAGHTLWNLAASTRCSLAGAINVVAFGPMGLYTGGNEEVTQWTSCQPGRQISVSAERVQDLAVAQDGTVAVVVHKGNDVLLYKSVTELSLPHAEQVRSVAFADDGSFLVTTSGKLLSVWNGTVRNPPRPPNKIDTGLSLLGAALNGDYVAVNGAQKVRIWRLRPKVQFVREVALPAPVRSIALSEDAVQLAMVSEEGVFSDRVARVALRRIGARQSVASDVVFLDVRRQLIVKRTGAVEIWDPEPSSADADVPEHRLARWMEKFALSVDDNGRVTPRVWNESR